MLNKLLFIIVVSLIASFSSYSHSKIYRYIDPYGRLLLTDKKISNHQYIPLVLTEKGWIPQHEQKLTFKHDNKKILSPIIRNAADRHQLPYHLIHAVIAVESAYNTEAISHAGAQGLMQLMPATADRFGVNNPFNPNENINGGSKYLSYLMNLFRGDLMLALAAYNAGEGAVKKYGNRIPPYKETRQYVQKVMRLYQKYRSHYRPN